MEELNQATVTTSHFLSWPDWLILGVLGLSIVVGLWRGFVRETLSLMTWIMALVLALFYCTYVAQNFLHDISAPSLRIMAAFAIIFLAVFIVGTIMSKLLSGLIHKSGLGGADRLIGLCFGVLRGVLVIAVILVLADTAHLSETAAWQQSILVPKFAGVVEWMHHSIPPLLA